MGQDRILLRSVVNMGMYLRGALTERSFLFSWQTVTFSREPCCTQSIWVSKLKSWLQLKTKSYTQRQGASSTSGSLQCHLLPKTRTWYAQAYGPRHNTNRSYEPLPFIFLALYDIRVNVLSYKYPMYLDQTSRWPCRYPWILQFTAHTVHTGNIFPYTKPAVISWP